jgi:hypothetical protein
MPLSKPALAEFIGMLQAEENTGAVVMAVNHPAPMKVSH